MAVPVAGQREPMRPGTPNSQGRTRTSAAHQPYSAWARPGQVDAVAGRQQRQAESEQPSLAVQLRLLVGLQPLGDQCRRQAGRGGDLLDGRGSAFAEHPPDGRKQARGVRVGSGERLEHAGGLLGELVDPGLRHVVAPVGRMGPWSGACLAWPGLGSAGGGDLRHRAVDTPMTERWMSSWGQSLMVEAIRQQAGHGR